jgi:hypothetical protein
MDLSDRVILVRNRVTPRFSLVFPAGRDQQGRHQRPVGRTECPCALDICHRAYVFEIGKIAFTGPRDELVNDELTKRAYLGA